MQEKDFAIFASGTWYAEITNKSVSKGTALKQICDKIGINIKNACAIGDAQNDLEMMKVVNDNGGLSIAMGNAEEIVKQTANSFTKHIDRDGYSEAVDEILKMNGKTQNSLSKFFKKVKNDARLFWHKIFYETQIDKVLKKLLSNITNVFKKIFKFIKGRF